jgi:hypothetical protein
MTHVMAMADPRHGNGSGKWQWQMADGRIQPRAGALNNIVAFLPTEFPNSEMSGGILIDVRSAERPRRSQWRALNLDPVPGLRRIHPQASGRLVATQLWMHPRDAEKQKGRRR